ncbi:MAG: hypothetical protein ACI9UD_000993 [Glaciecola sp.]|jgi:hypothetical protein
MPFNSSDPGNLTVPLFMLLSLPTLKATINPASIEFKINPRVQCIILWEGYKDIKCWISTQ